MLKCSYAYSRMAAVFVFVLMAFGALAADRPLHPHIPVFEKANDPLSIPEIEGATDAVGIPDIDGKTMHVRPEMLTRAAVAGMPFDLRSEVLAPYTEITLSARNGSRVLVSETMALPETLSGEVTVAFLANHDQELRKLRTMAKASPNNLTFTISTADRVIADMPFAEADSRSAAFADGAKIVGSSRTVRVNIKDPKQPGANGMYPDPECESACHDAFLECDLNCDHRGSCTYCHDQYEDCVGSCPLLCSEPKEVYEYGTSWQYSGSTGEYICIQNYYRYILWTNWESRDIYERTVHCNNTYTDVFKRTETRFDSMCKQYHSLGCIGNMYPPPPDC